MSLSGSVEDLPLLEILQVVSFCQKTGHLTVQAPEGQAGVVFRDGRVVSGYIWDVPTAAPGAGEAEVRARIGSVLQRLVRLRDGEFAFNLTEAVPTALGGRDLSAEMLAEGINPEELMLELARQLDEDRRDCAATLEASFTAPEPAQADSASVRPAGPAEPPGVETEVTTPPGADEEPELLVTEPAPETPSTLAPVHAGSTPVESRPVGPVVLIVDDEPDVCRIVGKRLADAGFEIALAASASHAGREMRRLAGAGRAFLLVVDLGLPSESGSSFRGGLDVVRQSAGLPVPPPVLLMADTIDEKLLGRAKRLGVSLLSFKPGLSKLDPAQYEADLRAFADKLARDLLPRLAGRRARPPANEPPRAAAHEPARLAALRSASAEIEARPDPDVVAFVLLRAARAFFPRVLLFVLKEDRLRGLSGFGAVAGQRGLDLLARELSVPLDEPSPFADAVVSGAAWTGPLPTDGALRALVDRIGAHSVRHAAVVPLRATHQTIAVVYADDPGGAPLPAIEPFVEFAERAGRALETSLAARRTAPAPA